MKRSLSILSASFLLATSLLSPFAAAQSNANLELILEDEEGHAIENLKKDDFTVLGGSDNRVYDFDEVEDGIYQFELNGDPHEDTDYTILIDDFASIQVGPLDEDLFSYFVLVKNYNQEDEDVEENHDCDDHDFRDVNRHWVEDALEGKDGLLCRGIVEGRSKYHFDPNDSISRAEFLTMVIRNAGIDVEDFEDEEEPFVDISRNDWEYPYVVAARELDIIDYGFYFHPNQDINRAEMVTMLLRAEGLRVDGGNTPFTDVKESKWYADEVATAYEWNLIEGFYEKGERKFLPAKAATRAEAAEFINNAFIELSQ